MRLYVIGQTGTGGSTLLFNSTMQDARSGEGFSPIDPHDNLAESLHQNLCVTHHSWDVAIPSGASTPSTSPQKTVIPLP